MASEAISSCHCRRRQRSEKCLAPTLDMLIFKSTDPNADVTYTIWRFDVQGWLDQYQDARADSGSQVNMVTPGYVHQHKFPILPLGDLLDHPLNLVGFDGTRTPPLGFIIL